MTLAISPASPTSTVPHTALTSVRDRQDPLIAKYKGEPDEALITDRAKSVGGVGTDPFHGRVRLGRDELDVNLSFGIHHAVGGYHDAPNPGDLLCGALAACLDSTIRIIAERLKVELRSLEVEVTAQVDLRGTLLVNRDVPVAFQSMHCQVAIETAVGTPTQLVERLIAAAEHSCVNMQTLRSGVSMETSVASD